MEMEMEGETQAEAEMTNAVEDPIDPLDDLITSVYTVVKFHKTRRCNRIFRKLQRGQDPRAGGDGAVAKPSPYCVVSDCCSLLIQLDNAIIAKYYGPIRAHFGPFFPELAAIVRSPTDYMRVVKYIICRMEARNVTFSDRLLLRLQRDGYITPSMATTIAAIRSSLATRPCTLGREIMAKMSEAASQAYLADDLRKQLYLFVDAPIAGLLAPNLSALLGSTVLAAMLIGAAGGLRELSTMPVPHIVSLSPSVNCTIDNRLDELLPSSRFPTPVIEYPQQQQQVPDILAEPYLGQADIILNTPQRCRGQACYRLAEAINLATAMDLTGQDRTGEKGRAMGEEICRMIEDWKQQDSSMLIELRAQLTELRPNKKLSVSKDSRKLKPKEEEKGKPYTARDRRREERLLASLEQWGLMERSSACPSAS